MYRDQSCADPATTNVRALVLVCGDRPLHKSTAPITEHSDHEIHVSIVLDGRTVRDGTRSLGLKGLGPELVMNRSLF